MTLMQLYSIDDSVVCVTLSPPDADTDLVCIAPWKRYITHCF